MNLTAVLGQTGLTLAVLLVARRLTTTATNRAALLAGVATLLVLCLGLAELRAALPQSPAVLLPVAGTATGLAVTTFVAARWGGPGAAGVTLGLGLILVIGYLTQVRIAGGDGSDGYGRWAVLAVAVFVVALAAGRLLPGTPSGPVLQWLAIGILLLPLLPGLGVTINGARAWISVGTYTMQPVEFARPLLVAGLALSLETNAALLRQGTLTYAGRAALPVGLAVGLLAGVHHDLGPALVLGGTALILVLLLRPPRRIVLALLAVPPFAAAVAYLLVARLQERVDHWWNPITPDGALQNTGAALRAITRGGWFGAGLGNGTPNEVANVDNDFVLAAVAEERGLIGVAGYILILALICRHLLTAAVGVYDDQRRLLLLAPAVMLWVQAGYVVLATAGILPVTGMVVPLLSSGGSALIATVAVTGGLLGLHGSAAGDPVPTRAGERFRSGVVTLRRVAAAVWCVAVAGFVVLTTGPVTPARAGRPGVPGRVLTRSGTVLAAAVPGDPQGALSGRTAGTPEAMRCHPTWMESLAGHRCTPPDVLTGLDEKVQQAAARALGGRAGSVVVLDVHDFSVLADYSSGGSAERDPGAVASAPGSTFKLITAAAALERGLPATTGYRRSFQISGMPVPIRNADHGSCGGDLAEALAVSCNTTFAEYAVRLGASDLRATATAFGYGSALLPTGGVEPAAVGEPADLSALARTGLGLQDVRATPLQQAVVAATVATGGLRRPVRFVVGTCRDGEFDRLPPGASLRVIRPDTAARITGGMRAAVRHGTATGLAGLPFPVAGKTGTADAAHGRTDGWLIGFAPADAPVVAVAVRVPGTADAERAGGASDAVPVAAEVLAAAVPAARASITDCR